MVLFTFHHSTAPADAYWYSQDFETPQGSQIRIGTDVETLEQTVGRTYETSIVIIVRSFASNIDRFYDIWIEYKLESSDPGTAKAPKGPYELVQRYQKTNGTFDFYHVKAGNEALYFRANITEDSNNGTDVSWSSGWQKAFDISVRPLEASERERVILAIPMFLAAFALIAFVGSKRD